MGCWNGTCGISQMPIVVGEDISFLIIEETGKFNASGVCYVTDIMRPVSFIMEGQYNDYGSVALTVESPALSLFESSFNNAVESGEIKLDLDSYYDDEYIKTAEGIIGLISEDKVSMIDGRVDIRKWGLFMWRPNLYNMIEIEVELEMMSIRNEISLFLTKALDGIESNHKDDLVKIGNLIATLDMHRKIFFPQGGKGSQDANCVELERYAKALSREIDDSKSNLCGYDY
jgi:hypothetical protein